LLRDAEGSCCATLRALATRRAVDDDGVDRTLRELLTAARLDEAGTGMEDRRLTFVALSVSDLRRSVRFYRDVLGIPLHDATHDSEKRDPWYGGEHAAYSWTDGAFIHFALYPKHEPQRPVATGAQIGFHVSSLDRVHERVLASDVGGRAGFQKRALGQNGALPRSRRQYREHHPVVNPPIRYGHPRAGGASVSSTRFGFALLAVATLALSCASGLPPVPQGATPLHWNVYVQPIAPGVWRHVSYRRFPGIGHVPSNGLVVAGPQGALVVDTAWDPEQTARIFDWIEANVGAVEALVVTHAHDDRLGGLVEAERRAIRSYALAKTVALAAERGWPPIGHAVITVFPLDTFGVSGELFFPGPAHTIDNATVWLRETRVLVGGCMVRAADATSMGNTSEADLEAWPRAVAALRERYPDARVVVPGHGEPGGPELLTHTLDLLAD
jgi:glyoxylase-like metal-dependent hydrolase (beta-lactamase superfamily II)/predicted enzyme related to lactoylglutathione lyase